MNFKKIALNIILPIWLIGSVVMYGFTFGNEHYDMSKEGFWPSVGLVVGWPVVVVYINIIKD